MNSGLIQSIDFHSRVDLELAVGDRYRSSSTASSCFDQFHPALDMLPEGGSPWNCCECGLELLRPKCGGSFRSVLAVQLSWSLRSLGRRGFARGFESRSQYELGMLADGW